MRAVGHIYRTKEAKTLEATQFLVLIDAFSVQIEDDYFFWTLLFSNHVIRYCKKLSQDIKLMEVLALYIAIARF